MRIRLGAALLWVAMGLTAQAAEFRMVDTPNGNGRAILMSGVITVGDDVTFHALAQTTDAVMVITTGPGGRIGPAMAIGSEINQRGWSTLVPQGARCASACSMIWLAGRTRMLADGAQIGFHAVSQPKNGEYEEDHDLDFVLRHWLSSLGYALDATATMVNTPAASIHWYGVTELRANGIPTDHYP